MRHPLYLSVIVAGLSLTLNSGPVAAAETSVWTNVNLVLISDTVDLTGEERHGGCMARLAVSPQSRLPSCAPDWVTLSCSGDFADPVRAYRMVDQMQLALVAKRKVVVYFTDSRKHNGYCFAYRVDLHDHP